MPDHGHETAELCPNAAQPVAGGRSLAAMDPDSLEQIRRLRNGLAASLALLIGAIAVTTVAAVVAMHRSPGSIGVIWTLVALVDLAAFAAAAVIARRAPRKAVEIVAGGVDEERGDA